jgi:FKBP-type peptidyl-prolyl cis-trans isomerase SlyD
MKIEQDTVASVHYTGTHPDSGEVFDSSEGRDPLTYLVGHGQMIPGFEEEMLGAEVGERREFTLEPERAYGERDENALLQIEKSNFDELEKEGVLEVGIQLVAQMPQGPAPFIITEIGEEMVTADFNHELAGKSLHFSVEVVEVRHATEEEKAHGHAHGPGGHHHH